MENTSEPNGHQVRSDRSTRLLIRAAGDLIVEDGYQKMTLAMVGERAGYSRSLATARFGSKAKLLEALVVAVMDQWAVESVSLDDEGGTGFEALEVFVSRIRDSYLRDPWSLSVMYALMFEALRPVSELRERFLGYHHDLKAQVVHIIRSGIQDGSIEPTTIPETQAAVILAQLRGIGYLWQLEPDDVDPNAVLTAFSDQYIQALAPRQSTFGPKSSHRATAN